MTLELIMIFACLVAAGAVLVAWYLARQWRRAHQPWFLNRIQPPGWTGWTAALLVASLGIGLIAAGWVAHKNNVDRGRRAIFGAYGAVKEVEAGEPGFWGGGAKRLTVAFDTPDGPRTATSVVPRSVPYAVGDRVMLRYSPSLDVVIVNEPEGTLLSPGLVLLFMGAMLALGSIAMACARQLAARSHSKLKIR